MTQSFPSPFETDPLEALAPVDAGDWEPGKILNKNYRVERVIGQGGMGKVFLVYNESSDEYLAVKTLLRKAMNLARSKRQFIRELRTWIDLPMHPNITACRYYRTIRDKMAVFSEYVDGGSLSQWIEEQKLINISSLLDVAIQVAWGIEAAHSQKVIHQDIKPSNVLMTQDGVAKITDFGLAKGKHQMGLPEEYDSAEALDTFLISAGGMTPAFCSPEQAEKGKLSRKTDIWSYGLTVLQMFIGRVNWRLGCLAPDILEQYLSKDRFYPYPEMPDSMIDVLRKCFRMNPSERWDNCGEIAKTLMKIYSQVTGGPYFREVPRQLKPIRHSLSTEKSFYQIWVDPGEWIKKLADHFEPGWEFPEQWIPEKSDVSRTRALNDLEIYEDLLGYYVKFIKNGRYDMVLPLVDLLNDKAELHKFIDDFGGAIELYKKSISMQLNLKKETRDPRGKHRLARSFRFLADAYIHNRDHVKALKCCDTALSVLVKQPVSLQLEQTDPEKSFVLTVKGTAFYCLNEHRKALDCYEEAFSDFKAAIKYDEPVERLALESLILRSQANSYRALRDYDNAESCLIKAFDLHSDISTNELSQRLLRDKATIHMNLANLYSRMGKPRKCLENHDRSIELKENLLAYGGWELMAADISLDYMNKAVSLQYLQRNEEALELIDKALKMKREVVVYFGRIDLENDLSWLHLNKSVILFNLERFDEALDFINGAAEIKERLYKKKGKEEIAQQLAMVYTNMAIMLQHVERLDDAIDNYEKGITIREDLYYKKSKKEEAPGLANLYTSKATLHFETGTDPELGIDLCRKAISLLEPHISGKDVMDTHRLYAMSYSNMAGGMLKLNQDDPEAWKASDTALKLLQNLVIQRKAYQFFNTLSTCYLTRVQYFLATGKAIRAQEARDELLDSLDNCRQENPSSHLDNIRDNAIETLKQMGFERPA